MTVVRDNLLPSSLRQAGEGSDSLSRLRERVRVRARALRRASTDAEQVVWQRLRARALRGYRFRRQHPIAGYIADFVCIEAGLVVELDGGQHFESDAMRADELRSARLRKAGFHILRFDNRQALSETDAVLSAILGWLVAHHPHPNPLPPAGEGVNEEITKD